jgi:hypothetical protein
MTWESHPKAAGVLGSWNVLQRVYGEELAARLKQIRLLRENYLR